MSSGLREMKLPKVESFGSDDDSDDDEAKELQSYVAGLRAHADSLCEQLQEEVAVQRTVARTAKIQSNEYWKECAEQDDPSWKVRAMKAEKEAAKSRQRAVDAEFRAAALEASIPSQAPGTPEHRELKLEDLLVMFRRMGVKMIVSSKDDELDKLMEDVLNPLNKLAQSNAAQRKQEEDTCKEFQETPHAPFAELIKNVRDDIEKSLNKLAEQHAWEMLGVGPKLIDAQTQATPFTLDQEVRTVEATRIADPVLFYEGGKFAPELASGLREAGFGDMPGQVPEQEVTTLVKESGPSNVRGKHFLALEADQKASLAAWEPELCAVWERVPPEMEHSVLEASDSQSCCFFLPETSRWRFVWDVICVLVVAYDCVITPLHVLGLPNNVIFNGMAWVKPAFWLLDIAFSFFSGYVHDGLDEMRLKYIAWRYGRTWLGLDALLLALESFTLIMLTHGTFTLLTYEDSDEDRRLHGWHGLSKTLREDTVLYAVRCLLVLRALKMYSKMKRRISWRIQSQATRIKMGVVNLVCFILLCCHISACGFYAIGIMYNGEDNSWVWINLEGKSLGVKYVLSLQWSLAQFTLGTTGVHPGSYGEASYAAGVTLIAAFLLLMLFARIVAAIAELASTSQGKRSKEMSTLMEYLLQCHAPPELRSRIWTTTMERSAYPETDGRRIHEDDVPILACLPHRLQDELRAVALRPTFIAHPLFRELEFGLGASPAEGSHMANKLHSGISEVGLRAGQVLFSDGELAENMYFVARGDLSYCTTIVDATAPKLTTPGPWFSEPPLWIKWLHRGEMTATTYSELFALNTLRFQDMMKQELPEAALCWEYAKAFAEYAHEAKLKLTDIYIDKDALEKLVHVASKNSQERNGGSGIGESPEQVVVDDQPAPLLSKAELRKGIGEAPEQVVVDDQSASLLPKTEDQPVPLVIAPPTTLKQHALVDSLVDSII